MTDIPVSSIVNVSISTSPTFPSRAGFGTMLAITNEITGPIGIAERIRFYGSVDGVVADWPSNSEVVAIANTHFGQQPKPTTFAVATRYETDQAAQLRGGAVADDVTNLALFNAISDGSFNIVIDGAAAEDITGLDFSMDADLSEVADAIEVALQAVATGGFTAATCTHDGTRFFINSGTTGASSTINFLTAVSPATGTDISSLLQMRQGEGTKSVGVAAETITASLDAIQTVSSDWYAFGFTKEVRDTVQVNGEDAVDAAATWAEARIKEFFTTANDLDVLDSVSTADIAYLLNQRSLRRTWVQFSNFVDQYPEFSAFSRAATVNFNQTDSTLTLKFKQLPGISVENLTVNEKTVLDAKKGNAFINVGGNFMLAEGWMSNGVFQDEVHGVDWLQNAIENNVFGYLYTRTTKVPLTDKGGAALEQQVIKALDEAVNNGLVAPGTTIEGVFLAQGYITAVQAVADIPQALKEARVGPNITFTAILAGAVHGITINGTIER